MAFVYTGASIEAEGTEIISRDIKISSLVNVPNVGRCQKYNCKRNSEAKVVIELTPKQPRYKEKSHIDLNDEIKGEEIVLLVNSIKKITIDVENYTGRHKTQTTSTKCYSFAEITVKFPNISELKDPKQIAPKAKQLYIKKTKEDPKED
jgi:hypothetical protein